MSAATKSESVAAELARKLARFGTAAEVAEVAPAAEVGAIVAVTDTGPVVVAEVAHIDLTAEVPAPVAEVAPVVAPHHELVAGGAREAAELGRIAGKAAAMRTAETVAAVGDRYGVIVAGWLAKLADPTKRRYATAMASHFVDGTPAPAVERSTTPKGEPCLVIVFGPNDVAQWCTADVPADVDRKLLKKLAVA